MNNLLSPFLDNSEMTLTVSLIIKSCLVLSVAGITVLFLGRSSAASRHVVWTASLITILILPLLTVVLPAIDVAILPVDSTSAVNTSDLFAGRDISNESLSADASTGVLTDSDDQAVVSPPGVPTNAESIDVTDQTAKSQATESPSKLLSGFGTGSALLALWLFGVVLISFRLFVGLAGIAAIGRKAHEVHDAEVVHLMEDLKQQLGITRHVSLRRTERSVPPMTWGLFRPIVVLPMNEEIWSIERLRAILLHELSHVKRLDWFTYLLGKVACTLHWFNPFAWFAQGRQQIEQEMACDDRVLASGTLPSSYATSLLEILRGIRNHAWPSYASTAMARKSTFEGRMVAILDPTRDRGQIQPVRTSIMIVILALISIPIAAMNPVSLETSGDASAAASLATATSSELTAEQEEIPTQLAPALMPQNTSPESDQPSGLEEGLGQDLESNLGSNPAFVTAMESENAMEMASRAVAEREFEAEMAMESRLNPPGEMRNQSASLSKDDSTKFRAMLVALKDEDAGIRSMAAKFLGEMEMIEAIAPLARALESDPNREVRSSAAWALGEIGSSEGASYLRSALTDEWADVRRYSAWALGEIEDESSVTALSKSLTSDTDGQVRRYAAWALGEIGSSEAVSALSSALQDENDEVREYAAWSLGEIQSEETVPALARALKDTSSDVRQKAAHALGEIGSRGAIDALLEAAGDEDVEVRRYIVWALGEIGAPQAESALINFLSDESADVRKHAARALADMDSDTAVPKLGNLLVNDSDPEVRASAAMALGEIGSDQGLPFLKQASSDASSEVQEYVAWAFGEMGDKSSASHLIKMLTSTDASVRNKSAWALGVIRDPESVPALLTLLEDQSTRVMQTAIWAIGEIGASSSTAEAALIDILENHENRDVRKAAARALSEM